MKKARVPGEGWGKPSRGETCSGEKEKGREISKDCLRGGARKIEAEIHTSWCMGWMCGRRGGDSARGGDERARRTFVTHALGGQIFGSSNRSVEIWMREHVLGRKIEMSYGDTRLGRGAAESAERGRGREGEKTTGASSEKEGKKHRS